MQAQTSGSGRRRRVIGALALLAVLALAAGRCALVRGGRRFELTDPRLLDAAGAAPLLPAPLRPALRVVPGIHFVRLSVVRE